MFWLRIGVPLGIAVAVTAWYHSARPLFVLFEVVLFFNLLIFVHELGHFLAAKWRGLVVEKFALWFGNPIWKKRIGGVDWILGSIPAGGYVALPQMAPMEALEGGSDLAREALPPVSALDKAIVAFAGPVFSLSLAFIFACTVWIVGRPVGEGDSTTVIGYVGEDSPASRAGLEPGDRILSIDGFPVDRFSGMGRNAIAWRVVSSEGKTIGIEVVREGQPAPLHFDVEPEVPKGSLFHRKALRQIEIMPATTPIVAKVFPDSPAARAGIAPNDEIVSVNGTRLYSTAALGAYIAAHPGSELNLGVVRGPLSRTVSVTPEAPIGQKEPRIGLVWDVNGRMSLSHPTPFEQIGACIDSMGNTLSAVFSPKSGIGAQHLSGPVGIMRYNYILFESEHGWRLVLWFGVLINVNLALLNLLPIPVLDGGHMMMALVEAIRRRPISMRTLEVVNSAFAALVIGFLAYVTFFDVQEIPLPWKKQAKEAVAPEMKFAPAPTEGTASKP